MKRWSESRSESEGTDARGGFTLLELLVTVAVIALLAAILLPVLNRARMSGHSVFCGNNQRQLMLAALGYSGDFGDRLPYNMGEDEIRRALARRWYWNWTSSVMSWELDADNTNTVLLTEGGIGPYTGGAARIYRCPSDSVVSDLQAKAGWRSRVRSYSMNAMVGNAGQYTRGGTNVNNPGYQQFFLLQQIPQPSDIFVFIEEHPDSINDGYFLNKHHSLEWIDLPASYHSGAANLAFADGHLENRRWRFSSTKPPARPDAAQLPMKVPPTEQADFEWLMDRTSLDTD
jgi:prepilin-type N-terminal cleavage/methylation domain-containing protein/prepilin-type processing-associated H-X9-DG protein